MAEAQKNGENLVKTDIELFGKFRNLLKKGINGVKKVPYLPKAILNVVVTLPSKISETAEQMREADQKRQNEDNLPENDNTNSESQDAPATDNSPEGQQEMDQEDPSKDAPSEANNTNSESQAAEETQGVLPEGQGKNDDSKTVGVYNEFAVKNLQTIPPMNIDINRIRQNPPGKGSSKNTEENNPATPDIVTVNGEQMDADLAATSNDDDQTKLDESIESYSNLMSFDTWRDYYNSFSSEKLEELQRQGKGEEVLSEVKFTKIKLKQFQLSLNIARAFRNELQTQATSLEEDIDEKSKKMVENENAQAALTTKLTTLITEHEELEMKQSEANDNLNIVEADILAQDDEIERLEAEIDKLSPQSSLNQQSSYIDQIVREGAENLNQQRQEQQGDTTATNFSRDEDLNSLLTSGMNNMSASQETLSSGMNMDASQENETGLFAEMDAFDKGLTLDESDTAKGNDEVTTVDSAWKNSSEVRETTPASVLTSNDDSPAQTQSQENENTGLDDMGLTSWARAEVGQGINNSDLSDEGKKAQKAALWAGFDNFVNENYVSSVDSDAKGRTR